MGVEKKHVKNWTNFVILPSWQACGFVKWAVQISQHASIWFSDCSDDFLKLGKKCGCKFEWVANIRHVKNYSLKWERSSSCTLYSLSLPGQQGAETRRTPPPLGQCSPHPESPTPWCGQQCERSRPPRGWTDLCRQSGITTDKNKKIQMTKTSSQKKKIFSQINYLFFNCIRELCKNFLL